MRVVVPVSEIRGEESPICKITSAKAFAFLRLGEGMSVERLEFKESFENEFFDYIVVSHKNEDLETAYDLGARALLAREGMDIEQIVEAMMFRELDEIV